MKILNFFRKRNHGSTGEGTKDSTNIEFSADVQEKIDKAVSEILSSKQTMIFGGFTPSRGLNIKKDKSKMDAAFDEAFNRSPFRSKIRPSGNVDIIENGKMFMMKMSFEGSIEESVKFKTEVDRIFKKHGLGGP